MTLTLKQRSNFMKRMQIENTLPNAGTWKKRFPDISNCILISDGLYEWFERWAQKPVRERGEDYDASKESITTKLLEILYEFVPQVKGKVEYVHLATPLSEETWLGAYRGGTYTTLCTPDMFSEKNLKWTNQKTEIPGLYVAGASAFFPGLTGAMYGGCLAACTVLGYVKTAQLGFYILRPMACKLESQAFLCTSLPSCCVEVCE